jgi:hypothetical protein
LTGGGVLDATGIAVTTGFTGAVALSGDGALTAPAAPSLVVEAALTGSGGLSLTAILAATEPLTLTGDGDLIVGGVPFIGVSLDLAGLGVLTVTRTRSFTGWGVPL